MIDLNELRDRAATFGSDYLTDEEWVEVIDRLEAAERNLNCCQGERMEAAALFLSVKTRLTEERDALRARIDEMEKQEPVAWARKLGLDVPSFGCVTDLKYRPSDIPESSYTPLYLAPGAQPAPSVPSRITPDQAPAELREYAPIAAEGYADGWNACINAMTEPKP